MNSVANLYSVIHAVKLVEAVKLLERNPFTEYDWWRFDARMTSPKTCEQCKSLDGNHYRGDRIADEFPYFEVMRVNRVKAKVHLNCRCVLIWLFRTEKVYSRYLGPAVMEVTAFAE